PHHRNSAFVAKLESKFLDGVAAHPYSASLAVSVAQHGVCGDNPFQAIVHRFCPRSASSRAIAARKSATPSPLSDEVAITSGNAAGLFLIAALTFSMRSA